MIFQELGWPSYQCVSQQPTWPCSTASCAPSSLGWVVGGGSAAAAAASCADSSMTNLSVSLNMDESVDPVTPLSGPGAASRGATDRLRLGPLRVLGLGRAANGALPCDAALTTDVPMLFQGCAKAGAARPPAQIGSMLSFAQGLSKRPSAPRSQYGK